MNEQDISLDGVSLRTITWGDPSPERAVLLIHGLTASGHYWTDLGPQLAEAGWFAIAPDLRGRGLSSKPPHGYGVPYHAADLLALRDALGLATVNLV
ncbi:MAG: alpha/beta fold hydrolase, partial [Chloroflexi bacterium]|nr:alpha/beta fold hydrolase [Chloroflexota bacterium]